MVLLSTFCFSENVQVQSFKLINNNESSLVIDPNQAQDLLNVDVTPGGKSVKKRPGYGLYKALATGQSIRGGAHFFDSPGNDVQVWGSSTSLYGITADATPVQLVSSATLNTTWDCADTQGNAYCVTSSRNMYLRTDGATKTWYSTPLGTIVEATPERIAVTGVSGTPNTIYFSESGVFTNFVNGIQVTSPFSEVIASPGSKLTHIRWGCGKLLWWKDQSFGYLNGSDQFNIENNIVSDNVGTFDNTSALDPGGSVWFRGQDGHIWKYDCSALTKESIEITPLTQASTKRVSNLWTQTSQADWQSGSILPTGQLSTTISAGNVIVSSFTAIETSPATWSLGTSSNVTVNPSSITLTSNNSGNVTNPDFESGSDGITPTDWVSTSNVSVRRATRVNFGCTLNPQSGSWFLDTGLNETGFSWGAEIVDAVTGSILVSKTFSNSDTGCAWASDSISATGYIGRRVKFRFRMVSSGSSYNGTTETLSSFILGGDLSFYRALQTRAIPDAHISGWKIGFDNVQNGSSTITSGSFTSNAYNTGFASSTFQVTEFNYSANTSTPVFVVQTSTSSSGRWVNLLTSTGTNAVGNQYVRYISTLTVSSTDNALSSVSGMTIVSRSSGTFYSAVKNAPNLSQWSTFGANAQNNGGSHTYFMRASTSVFTVLSATPTWVSQAGGGLVSASTGTYFQVRADFAITTATATPTLNDFSVNWFEGSASDQAYSIYFDNSIWFSVAYGAGQATNNYIFKNDLINDGWSIYNFGTGGFAVQNNSLYFGDTAAGNAFKFGTQNSDNGTAINSYWKSKDFTGQDPWMENQYKQLDSYFTKTENATATVAYALNTSTTSTSFSVGLSSSTQTMIVNKKLLPSGKFGNTFNYKVSDNSTTGQWEFLGFRMTFEPQPYRPSN